MKKLFVKIHLLETESKYRLPSIVRYAIVYNDNFMNGTQLHIYIAYFNKIRAHTVVSMTLYCNLNA